MARKKTTKKIKPMQYSDGKDYLKEDIKEAQSLEDLLGFKGKNPFESSSASEFEKSIEGMQLTELQEFAVSVGVFPSGTKLTLRNKLKKAFHQYTNCGSSKIVQITKPIVDPESEQGKALIEIIKEQ
jgi:hypothetical protein